MLQAAKKMRRVTISRQQLLSAVGGICFLVAIYLTVWTLVDAPTKGRQLTLQIDDATYDLNEPTRAWWQLPSTPIYVTFYCRSSGSSAWATIGLVWQGLLLLSAAILAMNTRRIQRRWNESSSLAVMTYSQGGLYVLRLLIWVFEEPSGVSVQLLDACRSFLFNLDALLALLIYFGSKLVTVYKLVNVEDGPFSSRGSAFGSRWSDDDTDTRRPSGVAAPSSRILRHPGRSSRYSLEKARTVSQYLEAIGHPLPSDNPTETFRSSRRLVMGPTSNAGDIIVSEASSRRLSLLDNFGHESHCPRCRKSYDDAPSTITLVSNDEMDVPARRTELLNLMSEETEATKSEHRPPSI